MDIKAYLASRAFWGVQRPNDPTPVDPKAAPDKLELLHKEFADKKLLVESFDQAVQEKKILPLASFPHSGVYISESLTGHNPVEATPLMMGYFLTEHTFATGWPAGKSRLQALLQWAESDKDLQALRMGKDSRFAKGNKPTIIEWALWYTIAVTRDIRDQAIPIDEKRALVKLLEEAIYNASRARSVRKDGFLLPSERSAIKKIGNLLPFVFKALSIPVSAQFALEYNPKKFLQSVQTGLAYESYHAQQGTVFGPPKEKEQLDTQELTPERLQLLQDTLPALFLFEKGTSIKALLKGARVQKGLPTVEPNVPFDVPAELQTKHSLPARLAYKNCIRETGDYMYHEVDSSGHLISPAIAVPADVYQELRQAAAPLLVMPDGLPKAKYIGADPQDRTMFLFMGEDGVKLRLTREQRKQVIELNPDRTSNDVRGRIDNLFTEFFVTDIKPHYAQYLGGFSREALVDLATSVKAKIGPKFSQAWEKVAELPEAAREGAAVKAMGEMFEAVVPFKTPELQAKAEAGNIAAISCLCKTLLGKIQVLVAHEAEKKAFVAFREKQTGGNGPGGEGDYSRMDYRERFEMWKKDLFDSVEPKERETALRNAIQIATKDVDLDKLIPASHKPNAVYQHFFKSAGEELRQRLQALGIPEPRRGLDGLADVARRVTYLPVEIFFERRLKVLESGMRSAAAPSWAFSLDKPLPSLNLREIRLKEIEVQKNKVRAINPAEQEFAFTM